MIREVAVITCSRHSPQECLSGCRGSSAGGSIKSPSSLHTGSPDDDDDNDDGVDDDDDDDDGVDDDDDDDDGHHHLLHCIQAHLQPVDIYNGHDNEKSSAITMMIC